MPVRTYRDLDVWQKGMDLAELVYLLSRKLPADERFGLTSQIRRAASSIPMNVAEGHGRIHRGDYLHHLSMARGSLAELETQLTLAVRLKLLSRESVIPAWEAAQQVGRLLNGLIKALSKSAKK